MSVFLLLLKGLKKTINYNETIQCEKKTYKQMKKIKHRPRKKLVRTHELYCFEKRERQCVRN
jgi:hypothetical protein